MWSIESSVVDPDPYSGASKIRIWIRIANTDPDPLMQILDNMKAKDASFKIFINNSETQLIKYFFRWQFVLSLKKKYTCFRENYFSLQLFWIFSFKIDCKTLDPDSNSMYLDPQNWLKDTISNTIKIYTFIEFSPIYL